MDALVVFLDYIVIQACFLINEGKVQNSVGACTHSTRINSAHVSQPKKAEKQENTYNTTVAPLGILIDWFLEDISKAQSSVFIGSRKILISSW